MAIKKSELYSSLWKSCDELRGGMDASQYKDYVLVLLFVKYVSDKSKSDSEFLIDVPQGGSFDDMIKLKGKAEIGDGMNKIISKLAEANELKGVIDVADFNDSDKLGSGKDMQNRLSNLVAIFENPALDFSKNRAEDDDLLGDAYEYLMRHFATESGKSKGQFYTPSEVSRIMAKVIEIEKADSQSKTVYDPTCGSGSLLLKAASETKHGITIYGQENDVATKSMAMMNMWIHKNTDADIKQGENIYCTDQCHCHDATENPLKFKATGDINGDKKERIKHGEKRFFTKVFSYLGSDHFYPADFHVIACGGFQGPFNLGVKTSGGGNGLVGPDEIFVFFMVAKPLHGRFPKLDGTQSVFKVVNAYRVLKFYLYQCSTGKIDSISGALMNQER